MGVFADANVEARGGGGPQNIKEVRFAGDTRHGRPNKRAGVLGSGL